MTTREKVAALVEQIAELPDVAQEEFIDRLLEHRAEQLGIYRADADELLRPSDARPAANGASGIL